MFGSYGGQFENHVRRICDVAHALGMRPGTVGYTCKRYVDNGGFLMAHPARMPRNRGNQKMTRECIDYITDPKILRGWAHLNLTERCRLIKNEFGVDIVPQTLGDWYRRNAVYKSKPQYKFLGALKRQKLTEEQVDWCWEITNFMRRGFEVVWIDETSTNLWDQRGGVWQQRGEPMNVYRNSDRGKSTTVFGALFRKEARLRYCFAKSTNKEDFL